MFNIGPLELIVILAIALLVVGPKRLPEVGRSIGRGLREFRKAQDEVQKTIQSALDEEPTTTLPTTSISTDGSGNGNAETPKAAPGTPEAGETRSSDTTDLARHLGKGLAELRRARDEIQRSFRLGPDDDQPE